MRKFLIAGLGIIAILLALYPHLAISYTPINTGDVVELDVTNYDKNLSETDTDVQTMTETVDDLVLDPVNNITGTGAAEQVAVFNSTYTQLGSANLTFTGTADLRVDGSLNTTGTALFATTSGRVGIGTTAPSGLLEVLNSGIGLNPSIVIDSSQVGAAVGADIMFYADDATPTHEEYGRTRWEVQNNASGNEASQYQIWTKTGGSEVHNYTFESNGAFTFEDVTTNSKLSWGGNAWLNLSAANTLSLATNSTNRFSVTDAVVTSNPSEIDVNFLAKGDTDAALFFVDAGADSVGIGTTAPAAQLHTIGTALFATTSGRVGIGTTAPAAKLEIASGDILLSDTSNGKITFSYGGDIHDQNTRTLVTANNNRFDILNEAGTVTLYRGSSADGHYFNGNVGIGTTAPVSLLNVDSTTGGVFTLSRNDAGVGEGNLIGEIDFYGNDDQLSNSNIAAYIKVVAASAWGSVNPDGVIHFGTANEASVATTKMVINRDGNVGIGTTAPTTALQMGDDKLIAVDVNAGLTASTTQEQGQGALTAQVNQISTVANNGDTVTLPSAVTGVMIEIINNGANTLRIFPASGDDLGLGTGALTSFEELEANESVAFVAYDTTNWAKEFTTEIIHAEIHDEDNTNAFVINAFPDFHSYHTNGLVAGDLADWAFDAGGAGTSHAIDSIADGVDTGNDIEVTTADNHLLEDGDIVSQTNLTSAVYTGIFVVKDIISPTQYEVAAAYTATDTGTMDQAATLEADAVAAGVYSFAYYISGTPVSPNETFDFQLYKEVTAVTGSKIRRKFGAGGDFGSMSGGGVVAVADGEKISFALSNEDSAANLIIRNLTIVLIRL